MGIKFASGGFLTTVQDMGRTGYQESGMSVSGVMDQRSAAIANILVGNDENEAVLEVTLMGPMMEFTEDNIIAVTGGNLVPKVNGKDLPMYQAVLVHKGDSMNFAGMTSGSRAYIAVAGGLDIPVQMGSKSTNLKLKVGGYQGRKIGGGDEIGFAAPKTTLPNMRKRKVTPEDFSQTEKTIRVVMGPQDDCFTEKGVETFLSSTYAFTNESDRMGAVSRARSRAKNGRRYYHRRYRLWCDSGAVPRTADYHDGGSSDHRRLYEDCWRYLCGSSAGCTVQTGL